MAYISMFKEMLRKSANASQVDYTFVLLNNTLGRFTKKFGNIPDQRLHNSLLSHFFYFLKWCSLFILLFFLFFSPCISHFILHPPPFFNLPWVKKGGGALSFLTVILYYRAVAMQGAEAPPEIWLDPCKKYIYLSIFEYPLEFASGYGLLQ